MTARPKVFCIGWHKTGTTSIGRALETLGFRVAGWKGHASAELLFRWHEGNLEPIITVARHGGDAFEDFPWPLVFRELDRAFPQAQFILTTRHNDASWLASMQAHVARGGGGTGRWVGHYLIYGSYDPIADAGQHVAKYRDHNRSVRSHFAGRPGKLLDLCFEQNDGWAPLCRFLGIDAIPDEPFPHANKRD